MKELASATATGAAKKRNKLWIRIKRHWQLYLLILPAIIYLAVFSYGPMYGLQAAFRDFKPYLGYFKSPWVGLQHFQRFFTSNSFKQIVPNTILLAVYMLIANFPMPIILAICLNYIPNLRYKKVVQNITYAPHFVSLVVLVSIMRAFFAYDTGIVNALLEKLGMGRYLFMGKPEAFRHLYVWSGVWQTFGWNSIIYIAALTSVDPALHESAKIDGASILKRIRHVDFPVLAPTVVTLFIMNTGKIMSLGFDKAYLMQNMLNTDVSEIIATYVYKMGLLNAQYSYATAVGLFNTVINLILVFTVNGISKKLNETSIW